MSKIIPPWQNADRNRRFPAGLSFSMDSRPPSSAVPGPALRWNGVQLFATLGTLLLFLACTGKRPSDKPGFIPLPANWQISRETNLPVDSLVHLPHWSVWDLGHYQPREARLFSVIPGSGEPFSLVQVVFPREHLAYGYFKRILGPGVKGIHALSLPGKLYLKSGSVVSQVLLPRSYPPVDLTQLGSFSALSDSGALPPVHDGFPLEHQFSHSFRVVPRLFMGTDGIGDAVGVSYPCLLDSLFVFRTFFNPDQKSFHAVASRSEVRVDTLPGGELRATGKSPGGLSLMLVGHPKGLAGGLGCFDSAWTAQIIEKTLKLNRISLEKL